MSNAEIVCAVFAMGMLSGLRAMSPIAVICWFSVLGRLPVADGWLGFAGSRIAAGIFGIAALGELVNDKLPKTPSRLSPPSLVVRIVMGGLCGALLAAAAAFSPGVGAGLGAVGAVAGSYLGYFARTAATSKAGIPALAAALIEDAICIAGAILVASLFTRG